MTELTPAQIAAIQARLVGSCTTVRVSRWQPTGRRIEVSQFNKTRLIETVRIEAGGKVTVLT